MRMYRRRFPTRSSTVMIRVREINEDTQTAVVRLLEFGLSGILRFTAEQRHEIEEGRIEPAVVTDHGLSLHRIGPGSRKYRAYSRRPITVSLSPLTPVLRNVCERRFSQGLHIAAVMQHLLLSGGHDPPFETCYRDCEWPSYEELNNPQSAFWNRLGAGLRVALRASFRAVTYYSHRIMDNSILPSTRLVQPDEGYCYVIALIRQFECVLKRDGVLNPEQSLSIQDFMNQLPHALGPECRNLLLAAEVLVNRGALLDRDGGALTFNRDDPVRRVGAMEVHRPQGFFYMELAHGNKTMVSNWNNQVKELLMMAGPIVCSVIWFPSYDNDGAVRRRIHPGEILRPTTAEQQYFINHPGQRIIWPSHTMVLSGHGKDEFGNAYWEFVNSFGNVSHGDRGYIRLAETENTIFLVEYGAYNQE